MLVLALIAALAEIVREHNALVFDRQNDKENQPVPPTAAAPAAGMEVAKKP